MDIKIRPIKIEDAEGINALRIMDGVRENILGITSERIDRSKNFISNLNNNAHMYVEEIIENEESKISNSVSDIYCDCTIAGMVFLWNRTWNCG